MTGPGEPAGLEGDAARLEEVARRLRDDDVPPGELRALAEEALELSARITDGVARLLRGDAG
jgi:hypothetical protein